MRARRWKFATGTSREISVGSRKGGSLSCTFVIPGVGVDAASRSFCRRSGNALSGLPMEDQVRRINSDYGFNLSEEEIQSIARRAEEFERLFCCLYEIDLTATAPLLKFDRRA